MRVFAGLSAAFLAAAALSCASPAGRHVKTAHTYEQMDNFPGAVAEWREAQRLDPENAEAAKALQTNAERIRTASDACYLKGIEHYTNGKLDEAMDAWLDCLRLTPDNAKAGEYLKKARDKKKSIESYK